MMGRCEQMLLEMQPGPESEGHLCSVKDLGIYPVENENLLWGSSRGL